MMRTGEGNMFNEEPMIVSDDNEEELDIYAALGLNTPIEPTTLDLFT